MKFVIQEILMIANEKGSTRYKITFTSVNGSVLIIWSDKPLVVEINESLSYTLTEIDNLFNH